MPCVGADRGRLALPRLPPRPPRPTPATSRRCASAQVIREYIPAGSVCAYGAVVDTHTVGLTQALEETRTGDVWLFRGHSGPDRAIQTMTNSPVNHVGMSVAIEDLPPLMWHSELGPSLTEVWTGTRHRGVQLHDLREAVIIWATRYGQRAWLRQLDPVVTSEMEDAVLRTIARLDGTPFPSTARLASGWLAGRVPTPRRRASGAELAKAYCA